MVIYTGTGDEGETSTLSGQKLSKNDAAIHLEGTLDELNAHLGLIKTLFSDATTRQYIEGIQLSLMKLMAHVSQPENRQHFFSDDAAGALEGEIDRLSAGLPQCLHMVVPGKNATEAQIHIARTVARRAERMFFAVNAERGLCREAGVYLNRLSDYLFVLARRQRTGEEGVNLAQGVMYEK